MMRAAEFLPSAFCVLPSAFAALPSRSRRPTSTKRRRRMVEEEIVGGGVKNERVIQAMRDTPRHEFVPHDQQKNAYFDMALPIGEGQTIRRRSSWPT